jgi:hypothetical protein
MQEWKAWLRVTVALRREISVSMDFCKTRQNCYRYNNNDYCKCAREG